MDTVNAVRYNTLIDVREEDENTLSLMLLKCEELILFIFKWNGLQSIIGYRKIKEFCVMVYVGKFQGYYRLDEIDKIEGI